MPDKTATARALGKANAYADLGDTETAATWLATLVTLFGDEIADRTTELLADAR